jgi:hypothetical protein
MLLCLHGRRKVVQPPDMTNLWSNENHGSYFFCSERQRDQSTRLSEADFLMGFILWRGSMAVNCGCVKKLFAAHWMNTNFRPAYCPNPWRASPLTVRITGCFLPTGLEEFFSQVVWQEGWNKMHVQTYHRTVFWGMGTKEKKSMMLV